MPNSVPAVTALVALLIVLAGCSAMPGDGPSSDDRAVEVRADAAEALAAVDSYDYEIEGHAEAEQGTESISISVSGNGSVNRTRRVMRVVVRSDGHARESYLFDNKSSMQCQEPWGGWDVTNLSRDADWFTATPLGRQQAILERTNVYWVGNRTLDGNRTVVIDAHPSVDTLRSLPTVRTGPDLSDMKGVENISLRVWVDPETRRPVQSRLRIEVVRGDATANATIWTDYEDYNDPVTVTVPAEAKKDEYKLGCPG